MSKQITIDNSAAPIALQAGQQQNITLSKGQHVKLQELIGGKTKDAANLVATRMGSDLRVKFVDGTEVVFANFYQLCEGNACSVTVGDSELGSFTIGSDTPTGTQLADGSELVHYSFADAASLMDMATGEGAFIKTQAAEEAAAGGGGEAAVPTLAWVLGGLMLAAIVSDDDSSSDSSAPAGDVVPEPDPDVVPDPDTDGGGGEEPPEETYRLISQDDDLDASDLEGPVVFDGSLVDITENFTFSVKGGFNKPGNRSVELTFTDGSYMLIDLGSGEPKESAVVDTILAYFNGNEVTLYNPDGSVKAIYESGVSALASSVSSEDSESDEGHISGEDGEDDEGHDDHDGTLISVLFEGEGEFPDLLNVVFTTDATVGNIKTPTTNIEDIENDIEGVYFANTLTNGDGLVGSTSDRDIINAELLADETTTTPTSISSVEVFNLTAVDHGVENGFAEINMSNVEGAQEVWNVASNADLTVTNVQNPVAVGLDDVIGGNAYTVEYGSIMVPMISESENGVPVVQTVITRSSGELDDPETPDDEAQAVELSINGGMVDTLNLLARGDNNLHLMGEIAEVSSMVIEPELSTSNSGNLLLRGENDFTALETLTAATYNGNLDVNVSGSVLLESVVTGGGDDRVAIDLDAMGEALNVDLGLGNNTLVLASGTQNAFDFSEGSYANIQMIEIAATTGLANVGVDGLANVGGLETLYFNNGITSSLAFNSAVTDDPVTELVDETLLGSPATLEVAVNGNIGQSMGSITLDSGDIEDLTLSAENLHIGEVVSNGLEVLAIDATLGDAALTIDLDDSVVDDLREVSVVATGDASLVLAGKDSSTTGSNTYEIQTLTFEVTGTGNPSASKGSISILGLPTRQNLPLLTYSTSVNGNQGSSDKHDYQVADQVATWLNTNYGDLLSATANGDTKTVTLTWNSYGDQSPLSASVTPDAGGGTATATVNSTEQQKGSVSTFVPGEGFESLETITVTAAEGGTATVELDDVYGTGEPIAVTVSALMEGSAGGDAFITIGDTGDLTIDITNVEDVSTFYFVGNDIADIDITGFIAGTNGDVLDFSDFGSDLEFVDFDDETDDFEFAEINGDLIVSASDGQFAGLITLANVDLDQMVSANFIA